MARKKKDRGGLVVFLFLLALVIPGVVSETLENEIVTAITVIYYIIMGIVIVTVAGMWPLVIGILILMAITIYIGNA